MWGLHIKRNQTLSRLIFEKMIDRNVSSIVNRFSNNKYGGDQKFQALYMYKLIKNNLLSHDSYFCLKYNNTKPFPTRRLNIILIKKSLKIFFSIKIIMN